MAYILSNPLPKLPVRPSARLDSVILGRHALGHRNPQHLAIAQGVLAGAHVEEARVDAGHDDGLAPALRRGIKDVLEDFRQGALPERNIQLILPGGSRAGVDARSAADAVLEDREAGVDLSRLLHALGRVDGDVPGGLGTS